MEQHSGNLIIATNIFVEHWLSVIRDKSTPTSIFRHYSDLLSREIITAIGEELDTERLSITTPLSIHKTKRIKEEMVIISILRSGIAMTGEALKLFPDSPVGIFGLVRDEKTAVALEYYWNLPLINNKKTVLIIDPMLATGGSIHHVIGKIIPKNPKKIIVAVIVAAPEGIEKILTDYPEVKIYTCSIDKKLNSKKFIVPGLGDFGDRYFGTG